MLETPFRLAILAGLFRAFILNLPIESLAFDNGGEFLFFLFLITLITTNFVLLGYLGYGESQQKNKKYSRFFAAKKKKENIILFHTT